MFGSRHIARKGLMPTMGAGLLSRYGGRVLALAMLLLALGDPPVAFAETKFLGVVVQPLTGTYKVLKDANVRAAPLTKAKRLGGLRRGTEVQAVGRVEGAWIGVRQAGKDLGFVYEPLLKAVSLPPLERDGQGRILDAKGVPVASASGRFLAASEVNLRAKPSTRAPKRGRLERGMKVEAIGAAESGSWLVVRRGKQELGFVFAEMLLPLIDGTITEPIKGIAKTDDGGSCEYFIRFIGKNSVQEDLFETADYEVDWSCLIDGKQMHFPGFMFITEAPFQLSENRVYQISIDLLDVTREYDEVFSTVFLYRPDKETVALDSVSMKEFASDPEIGEIPADSVVAALSAAANLAPSAWNIKVWEMLGGTDQ
jgi:SH3 domain-containing protein